MKFKKQISQKIIITFLLSWAIFLAYLYFSLNNNLTNKYLKQNQFITNQFIQLVKHLKNNMLTASNNISSIVFEKSTPKDPIYSQSYIINTLESLWPLYQDYLSNLSITYYDKNKQLIKRWGPQENWNNFTKADIRKGKESGQGISYFSCNEVCYFNLISSMSPYTFDFGILHLQIPVESILLTYKKYNTQSNITLFHKTAIAKQSNFLWLNQTFKFQTTTSITHYKAIQPLFKKAILAKKNFLLTSNDTTYSALIIDNYINQNILFLFSLNISSDLHQIKKTFTQILIASLGILCLLVGILHYSLYQAIERIQDLIQVFPIIGKGHFHEASKTLKKLSFLWNHSNNDEIDLLHDSIHKLTQTLQQLHIEAKQRTKQLQVLADFDSMTNIYNRRKFNEILADHQKTHNPFALIIIDLDHFKLVNDTLGHTVGDELLISIAGILHSVVDKKGAVGRMGGDEFALLIHNDSHQIISQMMHTIVLRVKEISLNSTTFFIMRPSVSIGISLYPKDTKNIEELITFADIAMYENKCLKLNSFNFYTGKEIILSLEKKASYWNNTILDALTNQHITPYFQPLIDRRSKKVIAFEVLARLVDDQGNIYPNNTAEFIHYAEQSQSIIQIDKQMINLVLKKACHYTPQPTLMINLSNITLASQHISQYIQQKIKDYHYSPHKIIIEITESAEIKDYHHTNELINNLRRIGIRFALDDFGTGYSSFNYISKMKFDFIKIDKTFLIHSLNKQQGITNHLIIGAIVTLAKQLNIKTVAEGVESQEHLDKALQFDIDLLQGYLFAKPSNDILETVCKNNLEMIKP